MTEAYSSGFDAHNHLDFPAFDAGRDDVCRRAREAGVGGWAICGADPARWARARRIADETGGVALIGLHPWWVDGLSDAQVADAMNALGGLLTPHGLGEIGLDHVRARDSAQRARQRRAFRDQLALARERDLPVALHCVKAWPELLRDLRTDGLPAAGGMVHGWSGAPDQAEEAVAIGLHVSFGTRLLRSDRLMEAARRVPPDRLLLETDAPDQPLPGRARGEPADVRAIADGVAAILGADVLARTGRNARRLLRAQPSRRAT